MSGICGIISYSQNYKIEESLINNMNSKMMHRGPDDDGVYVKNDSCPAVGLGHRRLKIIDLSESAHQPMANEDQTIWTIFDGEIYNLQELRKTLENKGHNFRSRSDSETVVHLYEDYGEDCVLQLRGVFAFAIWDARNNLLLLARDKVGAKPLLYSHINNVFCFASDFLPLIESGLIKKEINLDAINYYITFGYIPAPLTIYENVFKLPPAHRLILKNNERILEQYWDLDYSKKINISEEEAAGEVLNKLKEAVKIRLYSDVPIGAFLSGGIDSSTVVALMSQLSTTGKVKTFSVGFEEKQYSEIKYSRNIAKIYDTEHHEFIVKPEDLEVLPLLVEHYGEPYADSSCIPTYYAAKQAKSSIKVALNGDGGDELFVGYERYQGMIMAEIYQRFPVLLKNILNGMTFLIPDSMNAKNRLRNIKRFIIAAGLSIEQRYFKWTVICDDTLKKSLYSENFRRRVNERKPFNYLVSYLDEFKNLGLIDRILKTDIYTSLPNDFTVKMDIACMANSLQARSPFLDPEVMEFAASLPEKLRIKRLVKKYILKKAIKKLVPHENIYRRKMGFGMPIGKWFSNELKGLLIRTLLSEKSLNRGYFNPEFIKSIIAQHLEAKADYTQQLWCLLMLELWHRRFID